MRITRATVAGLLSAANLFAITTTVAQGPPDASKPTAPQAHSPALPGERVALPESIPDPLEPFNRAMWHFNEGLLQAVIQPTGRGYRFIVRKPVRTSISNFGRNITYPVRLINNLLEAKWAGARDETYRFLCNSVLGIGGLFDVAGRRWQIPKWDADFGQTFGMWGWKAQCFLMLPIYGPSNERGTVGLAADTAVNPLTYLAPYSFAPNNPVTYLSPNTYATYVVMYNNLSDSVEPAVRFIRAQKDPYAQIQYAWGFARDMRKPDLQVHGPIDRSSLETLESIFFGVKDPEFPTRGQTGSAMIPATGRDLQFTFWPQPKLAPIVYIVPGLGSHRLADGALALAELAFENGFSAVCVSNPFNYEFMENASTAAVPAFTPVDADDLHIALSQIDHKLEQWFPGRLGPRALIGYSMGAFESLFIAASAASDVPSLIKFDRYVAIDTPVRLSHGMSKLDVFYEAPLDWPAAERTGNMENTFLKVAALSQAASRPKTDLPFSGTESKFLVGANFRLILRDAIYSSQQRHNMGLLRHPLQRWNRQDIYREILQYSFQDYFDQFVIPYYQTRGIDLRSPTAFAQADDLRTHSNSLKNNSKIRVLVNQNDFLLEPADLEWLRATFGQDRLTVFPEGGHLGNLFHPDVQKAIMSAIQDLLGSPTPEHSSTGGPEPTLTKRTG